MPSHEDLVTRAEYHLHALDLENGECEFLLIDKEAARKSTFMDIRLLSSGQDTFRTSLELMEKHIASMPASSKSRPINYIFHTAFCCSTLISRCLDIQGICYAMREPAVFMQMANYKRVGNPYFLDIQRQQTLLNMVLYLLTKVSRQDETTLIKPTNAANNLVAEVIQNKRTHGILLLYSSLEQFLVSIIKKGEEGRAFVRRLFNVIRMDSERSSSLSLESLSQLTDLQMAAFVWYLQVDAYLKIIDKYPNANIKTLDCDVFLSKPVNTLTKLCELFDMKIERQHIENIIAGSVFSKYSKNSSQDYDASIRESENRLIAAQFRESIDGIIAWSGRIRPEGPVLLSLPQSLL